MEWNSALVEDEVDVLGCFACGYSLVYEPILSAVNIAYPLRRDQCCCVMPLREQVH